MGVHTSSCVLCFCDVRKHVCGRGVTYGDERFPSDSVRPCRPLPPTQCCLYSLIHLPDMVHAVPALGEDAE